MGYAYKINTISQLLLIVDYKKLYQIKAQTQGFLFHGQICK